MRIIDKNKDYYDYLQDPTDTLVFDRRGSFVLTKKDMCHDIDLIRYHSVSKYDNIILQCGASFWLFLVMLKYEKSIYGNLSLSDFDLELLATWKDYTKPNALLKLDMGYNNVGYCRDWKSKDYVREDIDTDRVIGIFKRSSKIVSDRGLVKYS